LISTPSTTITITIATARSIHSLKESGKDRIEPKTIAARRIGKVQEGELKCLRMVESGLLLPIIIAARACATALQIVVARTLVPSQQTFPPPSPPPVGETGGGGLVRIIRESDGVIAAARRCDQCQHPSRSATTPLRLACAAAAAAAAAY